MSATPRCDALREACKDDHWQQAARRWHNLAEELEKELTHTEIEFTGAPMVRTTPAKHDRPIEPESCANCRFMSDKPEHGSHSCKRFPATYVANVFGWRMPPVAPLSDWCGEWRAKP